MELAIGGSAVLLATVVALTYRTRGWWVPGVVIIAGGLITFLALSTGKGVDGFFEFIAGAAIGGGLAAAGTVMIGVAAILHARHVNRIAPPPTWAAVVQARRRAIGEDPRRA